MEAGIETNTMMDNGAEVLFDVPVRMRDGTILRANVFKPTRDGTHPVLVTRLPYGKDRFPALVDPLRGVQRGYIVVVQDVRGRGRSGGTWEPFVHEADDGEDMVRWAKELPGSNGQVGLFGASYMGFTQWAAASRSPAGLFALAPFVSAGSLRSSLRRGGARELGLGLFWSLLLAPDTILRRYAGDALALFQKLVPIVEDIDGIDALYASASLPERADPEGLLDSFRRGLTAGPTDPEVAELDIDPWVGAVTVPTLHGTGWWDLFLGEVLRQYELVDQRARQEGRTPPHLVIGPWTHTGYGSAAGDLAFGLTASSMLVNYHGDLADVHLDFFDRARGRRVIGLEPSPVELFIVGENRWRSYSRWPVPNSTPEAWYLHSDGTAQSRHGSGTLSRQPPGAERHDTYRYDPDHPVPTRGGNILMPEHHRAGPLDQRENEGRPDVLCFTSDVVTEPYTAIGRAHVTLYAASSARDTDFVARLVDVHPDGRAIGIADGVVRASWREIYAVPGEVRPGPTSAIEPDRVYRYTIDLWATGITFLPGHRIRLEVTSSNFPRWDKNPNDGSDGLGAAAAPVVAVQRIFHDAEHPSALVLAHV